MSDQEIDAICAEANRCWEQASIQWTYTRYGRDGVQGYCTFDLRMRGAAGLYTGRGRVQVDPNLQDATARGRVLAHECGHYLDLENASDDNRLMGAVIGNAKPGTKLTGQEIATARAAAEKLTRR